MISCEVEHREVILQKEVRIRVIPAVLSLLPPLASVLCAILFKQAIFALFVGVWFGSFFVYHYNPISSLLHVVDKYCIDAIADSFSAKVFWIMFLLGGTIAIMMKSGGALGLASVITRFLTNRKRAQLGVWCFGLAIFFADNENNLIVGSTMRPILGKIVIGGI